MANLGAHWLHGTSHNASSNVSDELKGTVNYTKNPLSVVLTVKIKQDVRYAVPRARTVFNSLTQRHC